MTSRNELICSTAERIAAIVALVVLCTFVDQQGFDPVKDSLKVGLLTIILGGPKAVRTMMAKKPPKLPKDGK